MTPPVAEAIAPVAAPEAAVEPTFSERRMRGFIPYSKICEWRAPFDPLLAALFTRPEGVVEPTQMQSIDSTIACTLWRNLSRLVTAAGKVMPNEVLSYAMLQSWLDAKGKKNSRNIVAALKKVGYDTDSKEFQGWMAEWIAGFTTTPYAYSIHWDLDTFDRIGTFKNVDTSSCLQPYGEWREAAPALASGFGGRVGTFLTLLTTPDAERRVLARAMGMYYPESKGFYIFSPNYGPGIKHVIDVFTTAVCLAVDVELKSSAAYTVHGMVPFSPNGSEVWMHWSGAVPPTESFCTSECMMCGAKCRYSHAGCYTCTNNPNCRGAY